MTAVQLPSLPSGSTASAGPVGVDIVECGSFADVSRAALLESFAEEEINYAATRPDPAASLAGSWAAKEALLKALGAGIAGGIVKPHELAIRHDAEGRPEFRFDEDVGRRIGIDASSISLSITHSGGTAAALVALPPGTAPLPGAVPMGKTGGIKNYEKTRSDILGLLRGAETAEAPPPPRFEGSGDLYASLLAKADDPELGPVLALAERCGIELRMVSVHPDAYENLDNAEESNDFRKLAPYAQLHFLALTLDAETYASLDETAPLSPEARGALLVNAGLLEGPDDLADARDLLLKSELIHEAVHFEDPVFDSQDEGLQKEWLQEAAGLARQLNELAQAGEADRRRAEGLVTDTLEGNPIRSSFDLELGDGTSRRIASKTFLVLEMELGELQQSFGTLTPDGMNPALFRLVDRFLGDEALYQKEAATFSDKGLEELLRYATGQDRDLRQPVKREMGVELRELLVPAGAATSVREQLERTEKLLTGEQEPDFPAPRVAAPILEEAPAEGAPATAAVVDQFAAECKARFARAPITPARLRTRQASTLIGRTETKEGLARVEGAVDEFVLDLRTERTSTEERAKALANLRTLGEHLAERTVHFGLALRLSRAADTALDELRELVPVLGGAVSSIVAEVTEPEEVWRLDDTLLELEQLLGRNPGDIGLQLTLEAPAALVNIRRLVSCSPRICAVELGMTLPAQLGWVFVPRPGEGHAQARNRRVEEAEEAVAGARLRVLPECRAYGVPLLRGPVAMPEALTDQMVGELIANYDGLRLAGSSMVLRFEHALGQSPYLDRLETLEAAAVNKPVEDPAEDIRLEEDLRVLDEAVGRSALNAEERERYWRAKWALLYDEGVPPTIEIPNLSLPEALLAAAERNPERTFHYRTEVEHADGTRGMVRGRVPFAELLGPLSFRAARVLKDLGVEKGDRVALSTSNTLAYVALFQGAGLLGAILVPLDPTKAHLADRFFNDAEIKLLVFDPGMDQDDSELHRARITGWLREEGLDTDPIIMDGLHKAWRRLGGEESEQALQEVLGTLPTEYGARFSALWRDRLTPVRKFSETLVRVPSLANVLVSSVTDLVPDAPQQQISSLDALRGALGKKVRVERFADIFEAVSDAPIDNGVQPENPLVWPYTGGTTTGVSKAAVHTHRSVLALGLQRGLSMIPDGHVKRHVVGTTLPFTHTYGFATGVLTPVLGGASALVIPNTGPRFLPMVAEALVEERASVLFSSRSALATLVRLIPETADMSALQRIGSSGDTLTPAVVTAWQERFKVTPCSGYGSTETPSSLMNPVRTNRAGTEGIPAPNVEARIVDRETGAVLPPGREGLLQIRGPHVAQGYAHRPDADAKVKKPGGWWEKDDIFRMDTDGYFVFCGRADDMFTVNELNVYPEVVEQALITIEGVAECGVIGVYDENLQTSRVKALVVPAPGSDITAESVMERARGLLEAHETPSLVEIVDSLSKSNFGKLARVELRKNEHAREETREAVRRDVATAPVPPPEIDAAKTVLAFPTGGTHWAGMGADLALSARGRELLERAEAALEPLGVEPGMLRALMAGKNQAERRQTADGWSWSGDFPLSVAGQTLVSIALGQAFIARHGEPAAVLGESMGEMAAYCTAGALSPEDTLASAYRWAAALQQASERLGQLRMVVVESANREQVETLCGPLDGRIVVRETTDLFVVALPAQRISELEHAAGDIGARVLVSNNPCAAHDGRLPTEESVWAEYRAWLEGLEFQEPHTRLCSTLEPGECLNGEALRDNLWATVSHPVLWGDTVARLFSSDEDISTLVQLGTNTSAYALEKIQQQDAALEAVRIESLGTLAELETLDALPGRCWTGKQVTVDRTRIRALAEASGDRNSYHLDDEYAARTAYGSVILHGVGSEGLVLAEIGRLFPSMEVTRADVASFKQPVKVGDGVRPIITVVERTAQELHMRFTAANGWGDLLLDGEAWLSPRTQPLPEAESIDLDAYGQDVEPFAERPVPEFSVGETASFSFSLDKARIAATRELFPGGDASFAAALGVELVSFASASFAPGYVLTGTRMLDVRRALSALRDALIRAGVEDESVREALATVHDAEGLLDALPLASRAGRQLRKQLPQSLRFTLDELLAADQGKELLLATWEPAHELVAPGELRVEVVLERLEGSTPNRSISIGMNVLDEGGRLLYRGGVNKSEAPPEEAAAEATSAEEQLAANLVQQKIINVFPVTRPRDAENSAADPAVNAALVDLEDAVSPTMRREARPRAVDMMRRVRRDSPPAKKALIAALQTARSRLKRPNLAEALLDHQVGDLETLVERLEFRKRGAEELRGAMRKPQQRLLGSYLANSGTRQMLVESVSHLDYGGKVLKLRPNNVRTHAAAADYSEVVRHVGNRVDALTIPKTRYPDEIVTIDRVLTAIELERGWPVGRLKLELLIEHPLAVAQVDAIAAASTRSISLIYGHVDYVAATGGWDQNFQFEFQRYAKVATVRAAHANGQIAIDAITPTIAADAAKLDAERAVELGFDGKWSIHLDHIAGIRQVTFPPPTLSLKAHPGATQFGEGVFDLQELARLAEAGAQLVAGELPAARERPADLRAVLRVTPDQLAGADTDEASMVQVDLRGAALDEALAERLRTLGPRGALVVSPNETAERVQAMGELVPILVLRAGDSGAPLSLEGLEKVAKSFPGRIQLDITSEEELREAFAMAEAYPQVIGLIHSLARSDNWITSGDLLATATALGIDALQGIDSDGDASERRRRAFRAAHMGLRGQVTDNADELSGLADAYTPPGDLVAEAATLVERYYKAERIEHVGAIPYEFTYLLEQPVRGLVDAATAKIFDGVLRRAEELGLLSEQQREIYRSYTLRWRWNDNGEEVDFTRWMWARGEDRVIQLRDDPSTRAQLGEGRAEFSAEMPD